jgi:hypothetical protein
MSKKTDDLEDIRAQVIAITDWLGEIHARLIKNHESFGSKKIVSAGHDLAEVQVKIEQLIEKECKSTVN